MEPAASQGDGEQSWAGFARFVVVLVAVGAGLTTLAQAVLPGEPAGVVSTVLSVAGSGLILARVNRLRGRRRTSSAGARTVPRTVPQLPRLPRLGLRVLKLRTPPPVHQPLRKIIILCTHKNLTLLKPHRKI